MRENFESAAESLKEFEGGFSNDADDPGGATMFGIASASHPDIVFPITWEQAKDIYLLEYWVRGGCDVLAYPLDVLHFDCCVNMGVGAAGRILKLSQGYNDVLKESVDYQHHRMDRYIEIVGEKPKMLKFLRGWMIRTLKLLDRTVLTIWTQGG